MRKNLQHIKIENREEGNDNWEAENNFPSTENNYPKSTYSEKDIQNLEHLDFGAGFAPYLRGINTTMYVQNPWKIQKKNEAVMEIVEDMKAEINLFSGDELSVFPTTTASILPKIAFYIVALEEQKSAVDLYSVVFQNNFSKDVTDSKSYSFSLKISVDILDYCIQKTPKLHPICVSGYSKSGTETAVEMELAYTLAHAMEIVKTAVARGLKIDDIAPRLSVAFGIEPHHFAEIAKLRAARMIWAKWIKSLGPKESKSLELRIHSSTTLPDFNPQNPLDNLTRICTEAASAVLGGTQSVQTTLKKGAVFSNDSAARIAQNTQLYLQKETKITKTVDPWAGSFCVESWTHEIAQNTWKQIEKIETFGGMTKAIEAGILQLDSKEEQASRIYTPNLEKTSTNRDAQKVAISLENLNRCIQNEEGNLLEYAVEAARNRATANEIGTPLKTRLGS